MLENLRVEGLVQKADFSSGAAKLGDEIKTKWWKRNKARYLKGIVS